MGGIKGKLLEWMKDYLEKKGNENNCNYRGIRLLSVPGNIYGRILNERMMKITDKSVGDEQGGFWKGRGCVDQSFAVKILVEKYLEKDRKLFAAFMDLEKAYGDVDRKGLWDTLRVYGVGGQLLEGIMFFYKNASASVRVNGELSEIFYIEVGVRQECIMSLWQFSTVERCYNANRYKIFFIKRHANLGL